MRQVLLIPVRLEPFSETLLSLTFSQYHFNLGLDDQSFAKANWLMALLCSFDVSFYVDQ